ncbi:MAG: hypothetical protein AAF206_29360, partial [Bacteroidota bacterium]
EVFLLDNNLRLRYKGAIDDNAHVPQNVEKQYVRDAIAALERGETPPITQTKSIGCSIKAKRRLSQNDGRPPRGQRDERGERGERGGPPSPDQIMQMMDKNQDQKLSLAEVEGPLKRDFARIDKDGDSFLTKAELTEAHKARRR